jgi:hypothetical protein
VYIVALGTVIGHSCCTALAVVGGRYVSTKISVKHGSYPLAYRDGFPGDSLPSSHVRRVNLIPPIWLDIFLRSHVYEAGCRHVDTYKRRWTIVIGTYLINNQTIYGIWGR